MKWKEIGIFWWALVPLFLSAQDPQHIFDSLSRVHEVTVETVGSSYVESLQANVSRDLFISGSSSGSVTVEFEEWHHRIDGRILISSLLKTDKTLGCLPPLKKVFELPDGQPGLLLFSSQGSFSNGIGGNSSRFYISIIQMGIGIERELCTVEENPADRTVIIGSTNLKYRKLDDIIWKDGRLRIHAGPINDFDQGKPDVYEIKFVLKKGRNVAKVVRVRS